MNSIDRQYKELLLQIIHFGVDKKDRTGTGTKSIFGWQIRHNMKEGFPLLTTKKMAWKTIVTELLWFLRGDTNIKFLVDNGCHIWDGDAWANYQRKVLKKFENDTTIAGYAITNKEEFINKIKTDDEFAKQWGELGPIYGNQWRSWNNLKWEATDQIDPSHPYRTMLKWNLEGIDQIANLISELKTNPDSRRLMVSAWNVGELDQMVLPPCHFSWQCYSHENDGKRYLSLAWNQRSVDVGLGLPFNIASYALLLEIIAEEVDMIPYELIGNLGDCHIYNNHINGLAEQCARYPYELPKLNINNFRSDTNSVIFDTTKWSHEDFKIENYQSHPPIKLPLSN